MKRGTYKRTNEIKEKNRKSNLGQFVSIERRNKVKLAKKGNKNVLGKHWKIKDTSKMKGIKHHNWQGGLSFLPYSTDWTETLRISIRERDKYTCQICFKKQGDIAFCVHHIDYNKKNCNPDNLITLCNNCHTKTNYNRNYWLNYFRNICR